MREITEIEKKRRQKKRIKARRNAVIFFGAIIFVAVIFMIRDFLASFDPFYYLDTMTAGNGSGYPITTDGTYISETADYRGSLAVLTDVDLTVYTSSGAKLFSVQHSYANPRITISGSRILLYDLGGASYRLIGRSGDVYEEQKISDTILAADLSYYGDVAISSSSVSSTTKVSVYDIENNEVYSYYSEDKYITDVNFSDDNIFINAIYDLNSTISTDIIAIDISGEVIGKTTLTDEVIYKSEVIGDELYLISDSRYIVLNKKLIEVESVSFESREVTAADIGDNSYTAVVLSEDSLAKIKKVVIIRGGEIISETEYDGDIVEIVSDGDGIYIFDGDGYILLNRYGEEISSFDSQIYSEHYIVLSDIYSVEKNKIYRME